MAISYIQRTRYDKNNDILYIHFSQSFSKAYADDGPKGIEIMRDIDTDFVVGLIVYYPLRDRIDRQLKLGLLGYDFMLSEYLY